MKDSEARNVINLMQQRLEQLEAEIELLKYPHPEDCECKFCRGWTPDYFLTTLNNSMNKGCYQWFKENTVEQPDSGLSKKRERK